MILEIKRLLAKGAYTGGFSFEYEPSQDAVMLPLCKIAGSVKVSGSYEIFEDDSVDVSLKIEYELEGQCSYCLKETKSRIEYSQDVTFDEGEAREDGYSYSGGKLDLTQAVNDMIVFSQPGVLLCKPDCKGIKID